MNETIMAKLQELENNQEFNEKLDACASPAEMVKVMAEYGIECTEADFSYVTADANGELSEDSLDAVSGGGLWGWFKKWYEKRKKKNTDDLRRLSDF